MQATKEGDDDMHRDQECFHSANHLRRRLYLWPGTNPKRRASKLFLHLTMLDKLLS